MILQNILMSKGHYAPETGVLFISIDDTAEYIDGEGALRPRNGSIIYFRR
jgi:hypothetical protein